MADSEVPWTTSTTIKKLAEETRQENFLSPFFGENTPVKRQNFHPCQAVSKRVHLCLDEHNNDGRFCQSVSNLLQQCMRDYNL